MLIESHLTLPIGMTGDRIGLKQFVRKRQMITSLHIVMEMTTLLFSKRKE